LPELLERLGPQTLTPAHQAKVKAVAVRLPELSGDAYSTIYGKLNADFHVGRYSDIPDAQWEQVEAWFRCELDDAERRHRHGGR